MDITRAFSYIFDDDEWAGKVALALVWTLVASIPLIGLFGFAILAGYVVELLKNMRRRAEKPLPTWDNLGEKLADGANVLIAWIVYNLGNGILACGLVLILPAFGLAESGQSTTTGDAATVAILCCLTILLFAYNLIIWPLLAIGLVYYAESGQITSFFQTGRLLATVNRNMGATVQWIIFTIFASLVLGVLNVIPCIGWAASLALTVPVQGHLLGQFARMLDSKPKNKPKPA
jgi:hypothetical protein